MEKPTAVVGVLRDRDRFLVIKRATKVAAPGYWTPPSGRLEPETRWVTPAELAELEPTFAGDHEFVERVLPTLG